MGWQGGAHVGFVCTGPLQWNPGLTVEHKGTDVDCKRYKGNTQPKVQGGSSQSAGGEREGRFHGKGDIC